MWKRIICAIATGDTHRITPVLCGRLRLLLSESDPPTVLAIHTDGLPKDKTVWDVPGKVFFILLATSQPSSVRAYFRTGLPRS